MQKCMLVALGRSNVRVEHEKWEFDSFWTELWEDRKERCPAMCRMIHPKARRDVVGAHVR